MSNDTLTVEITELVTLIDRISRYQDSLRMSDKTFCARFNRYIGSPKTWRDRLRAKEFVELDIQKWLSKLREFVGIIEGGSSEGEFFEDLPFFKKLEIGINRLEGQCNDRRILACLAEYGVGKTYSGRHLVNQSMDPGYRGTRRIFLTILSVWKDKKHALLSGIAKALNCGANCISDAELMDNIVSNLRGNPITLIVDEAHQGGVMLMRILKDLINETPVKIVYMALRTEFDRVQYASHGSIIEAKQFLRRCMEPVFREYAHGIDDKTVKSYLKAALKNQDAINEVAPQITSIVRRYGNLSTLADALDDARAQADHEGREPDAMTVLDALNALHPQQLQAA